MNVLPMESLNNAIGVYKTTLAVCSELADEDYSPALDKATLSFLEELKEYRGYGTVEEFKHYRLGDCMNDCEHYDNCADYIYSKGYNKAIDDVTKLVEFLIADLDVEGCTKYGNENAEQEKKSYDTLMKYEIAGSIDDLLDRLERLKN